MNPWRSVHAGLRRSGEPDRGGDGGGRRQRLWQVKCLLTLVAEILLAFCPTRCADRSEVEPEVLVAGAVGLAAVLDEVLDQDKGKL